MGASRLPGKVLKDLVGKPVLWHVLHRVGRSTLIDEAVVATTCEKDDLAIVKYCAALGIRVFVGSENDVLDRYYQTARLLEPDNIVRITADCPLHDAEVIDSVIDRHIKEDNDYTSNILKETFPDGLDCEIMKFSVLEEAWRKARLVSEREHVTQYIIKSNRYKKGNVISEINRADERWTLDTEQDYMFIKRIYYELYDANNEFGARDVYALLKNKPELKEINNGIVRNEGLLKSLANDHVVLEEM